MAEIRASFFIECEELLESLQDGLQAMFDGDQDPETVNVVFRAVHSIKGGAGAFGLDTLVAFAHRFETAMDEVRGGRLEPDADNLKLFFHGADILTDLVRESRDGQEHNEEVYGPVLTELDSLVGATGEEEPEEEIDFQPATIALDLGLPGDDALAGDALLGDLPDLGEIPLGDAANLRFEDGQAVISGQIDGRPIDLRIGNGDLRLGGEQIASERAEALQALDQAAETRRKAVKDALHEGPKKTGL
ncbi:MAG: Hpt domain-containing protein [Maritimibacter sp.]